MKGSTGHLIREVELDEKNKEKGKIRLAEMEWREGQEI